MQHNATHKKQKIRKITIRSTPAKDVLSCGDMGCTTEIRRKYADLPGSNGNVSYIRVRRIYDDLALVRADYLPRLFYIYIMEVPELKKCVLEILRCGIVKLGEYIQNVPRR